MPRIKYDSSNKKYQKILNWASFLNISDCSNYHDVMRSLFFKATILTYTNYFL